MDLPNEWFEDEVQYGFYVPSIMKRCWGATTRILREVRRICERHQIPWWISGGTLLGAVRHQGHIPWDDDIDLYMLRKDMERFREIARTEFPDGWGWLVPKEVRHPLMTWKLVDRPFSIDKDTGERERACGFPFMGLIDVFILDPILPDPAQEEERERQALLLIQLLARLKQCPDEDAEEVRAIAAWVEEQGILHPDPERSLWDQIYDLLEELCVVPSFPAPERDSTEMVAVLPHWVCTHKSGYPRAWFDGHVMLPFDGEEVPATVCPDEFLRYFYGDYMKISFVGNDHGYPYYGGIEEGVEKLFGERWIWHYTFSPEHLRNEERDAWKGPRDQAREMLQALERIHALLPEALASGDAGTISDALGMCQDIAVKAGTLLEDAGSRETVARIEAYCESVWRIYTRLFGDPEAV